MSSQPPTSDTAETSDQTINATSDQSITETSDQGINGTALTTIGEGKLPPVIQDVKDAVRAGLQIQEPYTSPTSDVLYHKQLNPSVAAFVPSLTVISTRALASKGISPIFTKFAVNNSSSNSSSLNVPKTSQLNPESSEFVPSSSLIPNGAPDIYDNGDLGLEGEKEEADQGWFGVMDIVRGFEWAAPREPKDVSFEPVLTAGAEMLLKVYNYPASFHEIGMKFETTLRACSPSDSTLINLAEMLIHWVRAWLLDFCCWLMLLLLLS